MPFKEATESAAGALYRFQQDDFVTIDGDLTDVDAKQLIWPASRPYYYECRQDGSPPLLAVTRTLQAALLTTSEMRAFR